MSTIPVYYSGLSVSSFKEFDRSFLPLAIQLQSHSTSVLIVNLILRAVKNLVRSPMNILAGYGLFRLQVALLEQHPNILQIDSHEYKSLSVYNTFPQTITKMPHWARMREQPAAPQPVPHVLAGSIPAAGEPHRTRAALLQLQRQQQGEERELFGEGRAN